MSAGVRVLVTGGRDYWACEVVAARLDAIHAAQTIACVIAGGKLFLDVGDRSSMLARGADFCGLAWAQRRGITRAEHPADWQQFGRAAGPRRNRAMVTGEQPDLGVAFPGRRGTRDTVTRLHRAGIQVIDGLTGDVIPPPSPSRARVIP